MTVDELMENFQKYTNYKELLTTNSGHEISPKEHKFVNSYMINGDPAVAAKDAGYVIKNKTTYENIGKRLLKKPYIYEEILYRIEEMNKSQIADEQEVMRYFTAVMRGEVKDQFDLDAPLSERTSAAKELAKRLIDVPAKQADTAIQINLNWSREPVLETEYVESEVVADAV